MRSTLSTAIAALLLTAATAYAHHPFAQDFDKDKPVTLNGTVTRVQWANPHVYTYLKVKDEQGKEATWRVEMGSPAALMTNGWTKTTLKTGQMVTLQGWRAKNGTNFANAEEMTMSDGKKLSAASSNGAPNQGELATRRTKSGDSVGTSGKSQPAPAPAAPTPSAPESPKKY